jgi:hypothetical protein
VHAKHEHLEKERHVIWTHLEARLEASKIPQVLEYLAPLLNALTDAHQILAQTRELAKVLKTFFKILNRFSTQRSLVVNCSPGRRFFAMPMKKT